MEYDSDTFNAQGRQLRTQEADKILWLLVNGWFNTTLDGLKISILLSVVRDQYHIEEKLQEIAEAGIDNE